MTRYSNSHISLLARWLRFNVVGLLGILVQLALLFVLTHVAVPYLWATTLAVEFAVIHNWAWHERYTWSERSTPSLRQRLVRLTKFNLSNGAVSLLGNLILMKFVVGHLRLNLFLANLISVATCSCLNFFLGDRFVFNHAVTPSRLTCCLRSR